jgi:hypothetical protein
MNGALKVVIFFALVCIGIIVYFSFFQDVDWGQIARDLSPGTPRLPTMREIHPG